MHDQRSVLATIQSGAHQRSYRVPRTIPRRRFSKGSQGPIGEWDVSRVTDMSFMFSNANSFNDDISKWDTSRTYHMTQMFKQATAFNVNLSKLDTSRAYMNEMFYGATQFCKSHAPQAVVGRSANFLEGTKSC